jgi:hypothetical protein
MTDAPIAPTSPPRPLRHLVLAAIISQRPVPRGNPADPRVVASRKEFPVTNLSPADPYGDDLFTEPAGERDTIANLGPLRPMAGIWEGTSGSDDHPIDTGGENDAFFEHYELQPIDFQTNGPQLFYGLRYHTHIVNPAEEPTFHDQVGYWLWEPLAQQVVFSLAIPRGQALIAIGPATAESTGFELTAVLGTEVNGIVSNPFLLRGFRTTSYRIAVTIGTDGTWSYESEGVLEIPGRAEPFRHVDRNTLHKVAGATPNPLAATPAQGTSLGIGNLRNESGNLL